MNWEPDDSFRSFNAAELDRESRVPDELYPRLDEGEDQAAPDRNGGGSFAVGNPIYPLAPSSSPASCTERAPAEAPAPHDGAPSRDHASARSVEDVELSHYGRDSFGRPDPRTHPEYWTE